MTLAPNVIVTPAAEKFIRRMVRFSGLGESAGFRLVVSAGGCSGLNSEFTVESRPAAGDSILDVNGVPLFLPVESRLLLDGVTVDFSDSAMSSGFTFINPNGNACACSSTRGGGGHHLSAPGGNVVTFDVASIKRV
jgi:iron-sulfur cluster assembly accessory protein